MSDYNFETGDIGEATGISVDSLRDKTYEILKEFIENDDKQSWAHFTKAVEENLTRRELAVIATQHMMNITHEYKPNPMLEAIKSMEEHGDLDED